MCRVLICWPGLRGGCRYTWRCSPPGGLCVSCCCIPDYCCSPLAGLTDKSGPQHTARTRQCCIIAIHAVWLAESTAAIPAHLVQAQAVPNAESQPVRRPCQCPWALGMQVDSWGQLAAGRAGQQMTHPRPEMTHPWPETATAWRLELCRASSWPQLQGPCVMSPCGASLFRYISVQGCLSSTHSKNAQCRYVCETMCDEPMWGLAFPVGIIYLILLLVAFCLRKKISLKPWRLQACNMMLWTLQ